MTKPLKTAYQLEKEAKEKKIYDEYMALIETPGTMKTAAYEKVMTKYKIHARSTVWSIINRVEARKASQHEN